LGLHQVHANVGLHRCLQVTMPFAIRKHAFFPRKDFVLHNVDFCFYRAMLAQSAVMRQ